VTVPLVRLESDGLVRRLVLAAPDRRNALDVPMLEELAEVVALVARDAEARVLVVSAEGKSFCAGADLDSLFGDTTRPPAEIRSDLKKVYASFLGIAALTIPTIAAVQGAAVGAGVNLALACDLVVAGPDARFVVSFAEIGLHPGGGCSWFLTRKLGADRALRTILAAETLDAREAYDQRLVTMLAESPQQKALELAQRFASRDQGLLRDMKRAVQIAEVSDLDTTLEFESWAQASSVTRPRFQEYLAEFAARRSVPRGGGRVPPGQ
jgi:enoyl-CoA hydratase